jgi:ADP-heptose:LPS heptosyltransferase
MPPSPVKSIERLFKSALHFPFLVLLKKGNQSRIPVRPESINSILILRPDKLGDMIVTVPVIHALKKRFPHIRLEIVASPKNQSVIAGDPYIDEIHLYVKNILKDLPMISRLRRKRFDIVYDPICHDSITGLLMARLIGNISVTVAARKLKFRMYYDCCESYQPDGHDHNIDNGFLIFKALGLSPDTVDPFLPVHIPEDSQEKAERFFRGLPADQRFWVGVNISAGSPTRTLTPEKFLKIINSLAEGYPERGFIIISVMEHRADAQKLLGDIKGKRYLIPENLTLLDVSAIISRLDMLISPDTSLIHIARIMKIPVVGLYSGHKRNYYFWRPYRQEHGAVVAKNIDNLHDIEPQQVIDEFIKVFDSVKNPAPDQVKAK